MDTLDILQKHPLFEGINKSEIEKLLQCLKVYKKTYRKDEYIIYTGNKINFIGIIVTGRIFMEKEDYNGNSYFYTEIKHNNLFGEVFICPHIQNCTVNYRAITDCDLLFIKYDNILHMCRKSCAGHKKLIENLINLIAYKSRSLMDKIEILSKKSLRERILTYLMQLSFEKQNPTITSPLNHKELSEYLCVNRSSMIRELKRMKQDGLIDFDKNVYTLLDLYKKHLR
ncbi:CRP-like cAMP-binding protein [Mobilisporobacter senegalensis]|uniref:CRP-like cAMP-binding protein n=1 Tax=Mobilisporobacter senegalensis TaxID=1329262 RepID=A0A3N1XL84_9FIRM|nr:Crp/Fnr family transcriptional regulator [Mobilisporobacter senegalensis]ROR27475.1 CRP-like cAMP-binding protein [Mobilisporobacter senegalensis]